jgi:catechol 2,3-dioxygenase-like lactoylglutathione lyase family enzyme
MLRSAAPVFLVDDVSATMRWYESVLGFRAHPFPPQPPHAFCVLERDHVEIMLQALTGHAQRDLYTKRPGGVWNAYLRMEGVEELYARVSTLPEVTVLEPLCRQPYGDTEFVIRDPNGYVLVFSEMIP